MENKLLSFCILCHDPVTVFMLAERELFFCNNPECGRFGLMTAVTTPMGNPPKEEDEEDKHKEI